MNVLWLRNAPRGKHSCRQTPVNSEALQLQQWKARHSPHLPLYSSLLRTPSHYVTKQLPSWENCIPLDPLIMKRLLPPSPRPSFKHPTSLQNVVRALILNGVILSSSVGVTWLAPVTPRCLQKRWPWLSDTHQTNTSFTAVLRQRKIIWFNFLCNWENTIKLCTASFSAIQYKSLHNKKIFFRSFIRTKRSYLTSSSLTIFSASGQHRLGGCTANATGPASVPLCFCRSQDPVDSTVHDTTPGQRV